MNEEKTVDMQPKGKLLKKNEKQFTPAEVTSPATPAAPMAKRKIIIKKVKPVGSTRIEAQEVTIPKRVFKNPIVEKSEPKSVQTATDVPATTAADTVSHATAAPVVSKQSEGGRGGTSAGLAALQSQKPSGSPLFRKPVIIKNTDNLPSLGKTVRAPGEPRRAAGLVSGHLVGGAKKTGHKDFGGAGRPSAQQAGKRQFKISSLDKAFEIPQPQNVKRKSLVQKKVTYAHNKSQDEKDFDIVKKKMVSLDSVPKKIDIMSYITPGELARKMNLKAGDIISKLISMGTMVTINEQIDSDTASIIAAEYGCEVHIVDLYQETIIEGEESKEENRKTRAPIVTVMGHVDHGKTKLLDAIRSADVASGEFGGITQHIGAYKINVKGRGDIVFIDTPGHAAFTAMRARGAKVTDIVVLVVAANDGVMPQTLEAIDHAKAAKVPIIVAINKCDLPQSNPDRVKQQLSEHDLTPEEWGGNTQYCQISALKKQGINELLESILIQAEMLELKADSTLRAVGTVLESKIDPGRGVVATVLVKEGTLHKEDDFVAGIYQGHVRTITNDKGHRMQEAGPSTPVEITGMSEVPNAGDPFQVTEDEHKAKFIATKRQELERLGQYKKFKRVTLNNVYETIQEGNVIDFNVIIKGDVQGSVEALDAALSKLETPVIRLCVLRAAAGAIIEDDVNLAASAEGGALIIAFNVRPTPRAMAKADSEKIEIRKYNVIYDVIEDMKQAMEGKLDPVKKEVDIGQLEVRDTFKVPKVGIVAGCMVTKGKITRKCYVRVIRDNIQISTSPVKISSLKRFKDDVKDVLEGFECGVGLENFQDIKNGDILEAVEIVEVAQSLDFGEII